MRDCRARVKSADPHLAIGMSEDAIDLKYAKQVADYIGSDHTEVYMTKRRVLDSLEEVIRMLGTRMILRPSARAWAYIFFASGFTRTPTCA